MTLLRWLLAAQLRASPGRTAVSVVAVALGVALALGIHLVNASALEEFRQAIATVNGDAHVQLRAAAGSLDEQLFARLAREPDVAAASPVLEVAARVVRDSMVPLRVIGLDVFRAASVTPALVPSASAADVPGSASPLFADDAIFLSTAAMQRLDARIGDRIALLAGLKPVELRIAGTVPGAAPGQAVAIVDIATAQWRFDGIGRLTRIDLRLRPGATPQTLERRLREQLPAGIVWSTPDAAEQRMSNLSRAYRVNLTVLALVALFTGGFIVFATMALAVVKQQGTLALLGVLGARRSVALAAVLLQGATIGIAGALLGVICGVALAAALLTLVGGDLGGGYFPESQPRLMLDAAALGGFGALGVVVAIAGSAVPALATRRLAPARALRSGSGEDTLGRRPPRWFAPTLAIAGVVLLALPPIRGLPIAAYLAIVVWLLAGIACVPALTAAFGHALYALWGERAWRRPPAWLAIARIAASPGTVSAALAGVVASFALASAMVFMVTSFRASVEQWLDRVLPADLYARAPAALVGGLDETRQQALRTLPGVARASFLRAIELTLDPARPTVGSPGTELEFAL